MEPFDLEFAKPEYEPLVRQAAEQLCARGLSRPDDFGPGKYHLMRHPQGDAIRFRLYYRERDNNKHILIGRFLAAAGEVPAVAKRAKPTGMRPGHIFQVDTGAHVQVVVDHMGLPRVTWLGY